MPTGPVFGAAGLGEGALLGDVPAAPAATDFPADAELSFAEAAVLDAHPAMAMTMMTGNQARQAELRT
jgi:hypothetical protein